MAWIFELNPLEVFSADAAIEAAAAIRENMAAASEAGWRTAPVSLIGSKLRDTLGEALAEFDLFKLFIDGWINLTAFKALCDPAVLANGRTRHLRIGMIEQDLPIDLGVSLRFGPLHTPPIVLTMTFNGKFEAVECAVRHGHIVGVGGGRCDLSVTIGHGGSNIQPKKRVKRFELPGEFTFQEPGIRIPHQSAPSLPGAQLPQD